MSYKSIMVPVQADEASDACLAVGIDLARRFEARLVGFGAQLWETTTVVDGYDDGLLMAAKYEAAERELQLAESKFRAAAIAIKRGVQWRSMINFSQFAMTVAARAADLIVVTQHREHLTSASAIPSPGRLVLQAGRPVLVVPQTARLLDVTTVVVAWKDAREARRALADSLPFLQRAARVILVGVCEAGCDQTTQVGLEDVAEGLRLHGVRSDTIVRPRGDRPASAVLLEMAKDWSADLIVAGGYGHTRLGEWVFGGFTRALLEQGDRPLLLSH